MEIESFGIKREIDNLGRLSIPAPFRKELGITNGDTVVICLTNDGIVIKPVAKPQEA